jgi:hypothetical protein
VPSIEDTQCVRAYTKYSIPSTSQFQVLMKFGDSRFAYDLADTRIRVKLFNACRTAVEVL